MTEGGGAKGAPHGFTDEQLARLGAALTELPELRRYVSEQQILLWSLGIGLVVGLAAHVGDDGTVPAGG
jgi:hypothetical protein